MRLTKNHYLGFAAWLVVLALAIWVNPIMLAVLNLTVWLYMHTVGLAL